MAAVEIPATYKAAVYDKPGTVSTKVQELKTPEPGAGEVLVKLTHSGVCHSDYAVMTNSWSQLPYPTLEGQVGGHEGVGIVVKLGPGTEGSNIKLGDRVGVKWIASACKSCAACLENQDGLCFNQKISGYYYPGTFQQYCVQPANYVTPIPDGLASDNAAPLLCGGVTAYSALKKSGAQAGDLVAIMGAGGGLGHLGIQLGKGMGFRMIGIDSPSKKDFVLAEGAEYFVGVDEKDIPAKVKELSGGLGAKAVIVLTSAKPAYDMAVDICRFNGTVVCIGLTEGEQKAMAGAQPNMLILGAKKIIGVAVGTQKDAIETLDFAARGVIKTHVTTKKLEDLTQVFQDMHGGKLQGRVVLDLQ